MLYPADYHMHTPLCRHAVGETGEYAAQAVQVGLPEIGFSDHAPMPRDDFDNWRMRLDQLEQYVGLVRRAQSEFPQLNIKLGLEMDYLPGGEDWVRQLIARHPWDYLIGSVHYVTDTWDLDNPEKLDEWRKREPRAVWLEYLNRLTRAAASGLFDFLGHVDLAKKFRFYPEGEMIRLFEPLLDTLQRTGLAIELNTAGLRKDCQEIYPSRAFLEQARARGIPITFGSDAHAPSEVGKDFASAIELARGVGYTQYCRFTQRRREMAPL